MARTPSDRDLRLYMVIGRSRTMAAMTSDQHRELEMVRWRLDRLCRRRDQIPFTVSEDDLYRELTQREAHLLAAALPALLNSTQ